VPCAIKRGAVDYLAKPADADDVCKALLAPRDMAPEPPENPMSADRVRWEHIQRVYELLGLVAFPKGMPFATSANVRFGAKADIRELSLKSLYNPYILFMGGWFLDKLQKSVFKYFYLPIRFIYGTINLSAIWNKSKTPTFPYKPEEHSYHASENDMVTFSLMTPLSVQSRIPLSSANIPSEEVIGISSQITNHESINYRKMF